MNNGIQYLGDFLRYHRLHGHGHVLVRDDGIKARCVGTNLCGECILVRDVLAAFKRYNETNTTSSRAALALRLVAEADDVL